MEVIRTAAGLRAETDFRRAVEQRVGLVPTMGAFHEGHAAMIARARAETSFVVVSIFVNPAQFGPGEDFAAYPRDEDGDLAACEGLGVDLVWLPPQDEVYPTAMELASPDPGPIGSILEGAARPTHFRGVLRVVHRLFSVTGPCAAYFGEKDAQQLFLVRRMVHELELPVDVRPCPTVRAPDGVAQSSRNSYLSPEEREQAGCLFLALSEAAELARGGERDVAALVAAMVREIGVTPLARLDYAAVVDEATFEPVEQVSGPVRALVAARFGGVRLIDNLRLPEPA